MHTRCASDRAPGVFRPDTAVTRGNTPPHASHDTPGGRAGISADGALGRRHWPLRGHLRRRPRSRRRNRPPTRQRRTPGATRVRSTASSTRRLDRTRRQGRSRARGPVSAAAGPGVSRSGYRLAAPERQPSRRGRRECGRSLSRMGRVSSSDSRPLGADQLPAEPLTTVLRAMSGPADGIARPRTVVAGPADRRISLSVAVVSVMAGSRPVSAVRCRPGSAAAAAGAGATTCARDGRRGGALRRSGRVTASAVAEATSSGARRRPPVGATTTSSGARRRPRRLRWPSLGRAATTAGGSDCRLLGSPPTSAGRCGGRRPRAPVDVRRTGRPSRPTPRTGRAHGQAGGGACVGVGTVLTARGGVAGHRQLPRGGLGRCGLGRHGQVALGKAQGLELGPGRLLDAPEDDPDPDLARAVGGVPPAQQLAGPPRSRLIDLDGLRLAGEYRCSVLQCA